MGSKPKIWVVIPGRSSPSEKADRGEGAGNLPEAAFSFPVEMFYRHDPADEVGFSLNFVECCPRPELKSSCSWTKQNGRTIEPLDQGGSRFSIK